MLQKVILIEDDQSCRDYLTASITTHLKIEVQAFEAIEPLLQMEVLPTDALYLIDWNLAGRDGIELVREVRRKSPLTPIIMMSGNSDKSYTLKAIDAGADDYIVKPFTETELLVIIRRCLSRYEASRSRSQERGLEFFNEGSLVIRDGKQVKLTSREYSVFTHLFKHQDEYLTRESIVEILDEKTTSRNADVIISKMRRKIEAVGFDIQNKRGKGYVLRDRVMKKWVWPGFFELNLMDKVFSSRVFEK